MPSIAAGGWIFNIEISRPACLITGPRRRIRHGPGRLRNNVICGHQVHFIVNMQSRDQRSRFGRGPKTVPGYCLKVSIIAKGGFFRRYQDLTFIFPGMRMAAAGSDSAPKTGCLVKSTIDKRYQRHYATPAARFAALTP